MFRQLLMIFPALMGGVAMALTVYRFDFLMELSLPRLMLLAAALLGPFLFVGVVAWRARPGLAPAALAVLPALLLAAPPLVCLAVGLSEGVQYILLLSPLYLWIVVAIAAVLELGSRHRTAAAACGPVISNS